MTRRPAQILAVLLMWVAAGQIVIDRCLIRCHAPSAAAAPACHTSNDDDGGTMKWQDASACTHDHRARPAEAASKLGPDSQSRDAQVLPAASRITIAPARCAAFVDDCAPPPGGSTVGAFARPLRI